MSSPSVASKFILTKRHSAILYSSKDDGKNVNLTVLAFDDLFANTIIHVL